MTDLEAIRIIEQESDASPRQELEAWAHIVRTGIYRTLQGFYGRAVAKLIADGVLDTEGNILRVPGEAD